MKIAFLHMTMGLTDRGSEAVVDMLASALAKKHDVMVIQSGKIAKKRYTAKRIAPLEVAPIPAPRNLLDKFLFRLHVDQESGHVATFTIAALPILKKFAPDVIVAINGPLQLRILNDQHMSVKIVVFGHAGIGYHDRDTLRACPDLFIALTPRAEAWAKQSAEALTKVVYIPNPIDTTQYANMPPAALTLDKPIVLTVAALSAYKNVLPTIQAVRQTICSYLLIGDGEQSEAVAREFSTFSNSFLWVKHVEMANIPGYYQTADVFCFTPDRQESFGMVYLEAMAVGLPIVASDDGVRRDLIGKQGIYVNPHNPTEIANGIARALKLGKLDYTNELVAYKLDTVVQKIENELHALIN